MYGFQSPELRDADAHMEACERREAARQRHVAHTTRVLTTMISNAGHGRVKSIWSLDKFATVRAELVAWVEQTHDNANEVLGEALLSPQARADLVETFVAAYAESSANLNSAEWEDA